MYSPLTRDDVLMTIDPDRRAIISFVCPTHYGLMGISTRGTPPSASTSRAGTRPSRRPQAARHGGRPATVAPPPGPRLNERWPRASQSSADLDEVGASDWTRGSEAVRAD